MATYQEKYKFLTDNGYLIKGDTDVLLSLKAVALLTGTCESRWEKAAANGTVDMSGDFGRDARRGYRELIAKVGTNDPVEALYAAVPNA